MSPSGEIVCLPRPTVRAPLIVLPAHQAVINIEPDGDAADVERGVRIGRVVVAVAKTNVSWPGRYERRGAERVPAVNAAAPHRPSSAPRDPGCRCGGRA